MYPGASRPVETGLRPVRVVYRRHTDGESENCGHIFQASRLAPTAGRRGTTRARHRPFAGVDLTGLQPVGMYPGASRPDETGLLACNQFSIFLVINVKRFCDVKTEKGR